ncbi:MAG: helicase, partial [Lachnospiraceae bacterium]|nr:helicase [Lachnospiraceae bacterium]
DFDEIDVYKMVYEKVKQDELICYYAENEDEDIQEEAYEVIADAISVEASESFIIESATECFPRENVEELIFANPYYQDLKKEILEEREAELRMKEEVLSRVPDKAKFLYPAARGMKRHFILHIGPTNSGKTHDALEEFRKAEKGVYLAPLRLLALEVYENTVEHGIPCNMVTGEEEILTKEATHTSQTIEMASLQAPYDVAVIDEAQMIADSQRGGAWTAAILGICAEVVHICMAPHATKIVKQLIEYCGDDWEERYHERLTPLEAEEGDFHFPKDVREGDALIVFSKRSVLGCAAELQAKGIKCSVIYGNLPYSVRRKETEAFLSGERKVVVATDAIGMGLNLPVKRIVFLENEKFDGKERRLLKADEIQQITGRAGRKGMHDIGYYTAESGMKYIRKNAEKEVPDITSARLHFPKTLITVNGKLSEIMEKWLETEHEEMFLKTDLTDILLLCRELEAYTKDKELIYTFCNLPFNQKDMEMKSLWKDLFFEVLENGVTNSKQYDFSKSDKYLSRLEENDRLKTLESSYQKFDMLYQCVTHYGDPETKAEEKRRILTKKEAISSQINKILSTQKLTRKKCRECGRTLSWKYPYSICQKCYDYRYDWY